MPRTGDRPFDWIAALAVASGILVLVPSLLALAVAVASAISVVIG